MDKIIFIVDMMIVSSVTSRDLGLNEPFLSFSLVYPNNSLVLDYSWFVYTLLSIMQTENLK